MLFLGFFYAISGFCLCYFDVISMLSLTASIFMLKLGSARPADMAATEAADVVLNAFRPWRERSGARDVRRGGPYQICLPGREVGLYGRGLRDGEYVIVVRTGRVRRIDYWIGPPGYLRNTPQEGMMFFQDTPEEHLYSQQQVVSVREWAAARRLQAWWRQVRRQSWRSAFGRLQCSCRAYADRRLE